MTKSVKQLSLFFNISCKEITLRCRSLNIQPTFLTKSKNLIYALTEEDIGRILSYKYAYMPKIIRITTIYKICESKLNKMK